MQIGIEEIGFSTTEFSLSLEELAKNNNVSPEKYIKGIGQRKFSILPPDEDIITLAYKSSIKVLKNQNLNDVKFLFFATESSFDNSKSSAVYLHELLKLPEDCRIIDLKQGCYSATSAIMLAKSFIETHPNKNAKCIVVASDIAKYPILSNAEPTQGAAAVSLLIARNHQECLLASLENFGGVITKNAYDFLKPDYTEYPVVNGKLSIEMYLSFLKKSISQFLKEYNHGIDLFSAICFHTPFPKMTIKATEMLQKNFPDVFNNNCTQQRTDAQLIYNKEIGNTYTASLYLSLISLLDNSEFDFAKKTIGLFSYGSGSSAEFFSINIKDNYKSKLQPENNQKEIDSRINSPYEQYRFFHQFKIQNNTVIEKFTNNIIRLASITNHVRNYEFL